MAKAESNTEAGKGYYAQGRRIIMFCPKRNATCAYKDCPFYIEDLDDCSKALNAKKDLNILTRKEKAGLAAIRKGGHQDRPKG